MVFVSGYVTRRGYISSVPTIRQLEEALVAADRRPDGSDDAPSPSKWNVAPLPSLWESDGFVEHMAWEAERKAAPVVTRDAALAMLGEMRKTTGWAKGACLAAVIVPTAIFVVDRLL